jgi:hypothetical protein
MLLGHGRRLAAHQGHADPLGFVARARDHVGVPARGVGAGMVGLIVVAALAVLLARPLAYVLLFAAIVWRREWAGSPRCCCSARCRSKKFNH